MPSFLSGRVTEEGTGDPVEGARVLVLGLGLPAIKTTNVGGWFNVAEKNQRMGNYVVMVLGGGYQMAMESVSYDGEPMTLTVELTEK
jgi:hypothetical protein